MSAKAAKNNQALKGEGFDLINKVMSAIATGI